MVSQSAILTPARSDGLTQSTFKRINEFSSLHRSNPPPSRPLPLVCSDAERRLGCHDHNNAAVRTSQDNRQMASRRLISCGSSMATSDRSKRLQPSSHLLQRTRSMLIFGNPYTDVGVELMEPVRPRGLSTIAQDSTPYSTTSQFKDIAKRPGSCITATTALLAGGKVEGREHHILSKVLRRKWSTGPSSVSMGRFLHKNCGQV